MTERKALTRTQTILLCQRQAKGPILCACGCGVELDPVKERVVDEHVIPRKLSEKGAEGERDDLTNRAFYRWPCALLKTKDDLARIAKAAAQGGETGQYARRQKRGGSSIPAKVNAWAPKGSVKIPSRKFDKARPSPDRRMG